MSGHPDCDWLLLPLLKLLLALLLPLLLPLLLSCQVLQPVTCCFLGTNLLVFCQPGGVAMRDICLSPYCVLELRQVR